MKMLSLPFDEVIVDITSKFRKITSKSYLKKGKYPIVDQSENYIAGFTNDKSYITNLSKPVIVFGDHTRILKYVDFDFAIGADGVKVLAAKSNAYIPHYLFYYLKSLHIREAGYSRHFKYLKRKSITIPETPEDQIRIAKILKRVEEVIGKRKESIKIIDTLVISTFLDFFGDPRNKKSEWDKASLNDIGKWKSGGTPSRKIKKYFTGKFPWVTSGELEDVFIADTEEHITKEAIDNSNASIIPEGSLMLGMYDTAALKSSINLKEMACNQAIAFSKLYDDKCDTLFIYYFIQIGREYFKRLQRGIRQKNLNLAMIKSIPIFLPPPLLQQKFSETAKRILELKSKYLNSLDLLEKLFGSMNKLAFNGLLDLSKIEIEEKMEDKDYEFDENVFTGSLTEEESNKLLRAANEEERLNIIENIMLDYIKELPTTDAPEEVDTKIRQLDWELKETGQMRFWPEYIKYRIIKEKMPEYFTFKEFWTELEKIPFDESFNYDQVKEIFYEWLKGDDPFLIQSFNSKENKKQMEFKVNEAS